MEDAAAVGKARGPEMCQPDDPFELLRQREEELEALAQELERQAERLAKWERKLKRQADKAA
jgi:hypothetical protein